MVSVWPEVNGPSSTNPPGAVSVPRPAMLKWSAANDSVLPAPTCTAPVTVNAAPSASTKLPTETVKPVSVAIWLDACPSDTSPVELPDKLPAISVPTSVMPPPVADNATVPAPPSETVPCKDSAEPINEITLAPTLPLTVRLEASTIVANAPPCTASLIVSAAPSLSVKPFALKDPRSAIWLLVGVAPIMETEPTALPLSKPVDRAPVCRIALPAIRLTLPAAGSDCTVPASCIDPFAWMRAKLPAAMACMDDVAAWVKSPPIANRSMAGTATPPDRPDEIVVPVC